MFWFEPVYEFNLLQLDMLKEIMNENDLTYIKAEVFDIVSKYVNKKISNSGVITFSLNEHE